MNIDARINLNLSQRLVMTPMLQQAIKLLQMSRLELVETVKQEMLENPILEEIEESSELSLDRQDDFAKNPEKQSGDEETAALQADAQSTPQESSVNWEEYFDDNPSSLGYQGEYEPDDGNQAFDNLLTKPQSLSEYVSWQLQMSQVPERSRKIGEFLIGQIHDDGYLKIEENNEEFSSLSIYDPKTSIEQLQAYRNVVVEALSKKINSELERNYVSSHLSLSGAQRVLANVLLQEYYDDLNSGQYTEIIAKLQSLTLEDIEIIAKFIREVPVKNFEELIGIPEADISQGIHHITEMCRTLPQLIEHHSNVLLKDNYITKLEKLDMLPEGLYLLEYLLSKLTAGEVAYIAYKSDADKAAKHEKDIHAYLELLRQSYAHIEHLRSRKYFLIQLYTVGLGLIGEKFSTDSPLRYQKLFLKILNVTEHDVFTIANIFSTLRQEFYRHEIPVEPQEVEQTLQHIHTFMPFGVGARDLKECLTIQARNLDLTDTSIEPLINHMLYELQLHRYDDIAAQFDMSVEDVELAQQIIFNMSPKPGADFVSERPEYIIPDIYVYRVDGEYEVVLNEDDLPNLRINPAYKKIMSGTEADVPNSTRQYVDQKLRSAMWFIRSVEQRKRTIYKVGKSLVKFQHEFLEYGVSHLKPLVLRDVADDIAMHESTISRVTTNKYIHTPQGVFELKFFFHSGLESSTGDDVSSIAIKERIKQMIDEEDSTRPLSDKAIEKNMKEAGIAIARRTIAKYREDLNIPSSIQRKRKKMST
ncbi:RNA polymerase sigma-54 factor [candidate division KSB3 bacterium]|uniref:RNA polymerase sigma-54 factor n=1 Tax=candidate division KSB3 bacterium TaxID=2044937 RepID=A0A2G6KAE1_9BACT|nr:MAG: RNA polymerase sigma-54 factor [candidate division KSB3 bacterium]